MVWRVAPSGAETSPETPAGIVATPGSSIPPWRLNLCPGATMALHRA